MTDATDRRGITPENPDTLLGVMMEPGEVIRTRTGRVLTDDDIQELADEAERGYDVTHLLADQPPTINSPYFDHAAAVVANSLEAARTRLTELRTHRDGPLAEEIRQLVADEDLLERMHRVTLRRNGEVAE